MQTSIYMSNRIVQALTGSRKGRGALIREARSCLLREGSLINGVITDEEALLSELKAMWDELSLPRKNIRLVIDSGQFLTRAIRVPKLAEAKILELARREFSDAGREDDVVDYMALRPRKGEGLTPILCCAAQRSFIKSYVDLYAAMGVRVSSMDMALSCQLRLADAMPDFEAKTCILLSFDGDTMLGTLIDGGLYKYSSRTRLFSDHGTPGLGAEVAQTVSGLVQFQTTDKTSTGRVGTVYLNGCSDEDFAVCKAGIENMDMAVAWFPATELIRFRDSRAALKDYLITAGDFIGR